MENKILVYRDNKRAENYKSDYVRAQIHSQGIVDFLNKQKVSADLLLVKSLIDGDTQAANIINNREKYDNIPDALKKVVQEDNQNLIQELNNLVSKARAALFENSHHYVDFNKIILTDGRVSITDEAIKEAEDLASVYIDTDGRKKVYDKAIEAKKTLEDLQEAINSVAITGVAGGYHILPIVRNGSNSWNEGVLGLDDDGEITFNGESFSHIV